MIEEYMSVSRRQKQRVRSNLKAKTLWRVGFVLVLLAVVGTASWWWPGKFRKQNDEIGGEPADQVRGRIIASEVALDECKIKVSTTIGERVLDTYYREFYPEAKCYQFLLNAVSPSGQYVVFQDISGGLDSMIRVYALEDDGVMQLDVYGTTDIFDLAFLPNDKLAVMFGWKDIFDEQNLRIYDIAGLFRDYPLNVTAPGRSFSNLAEFTKGIVLPDVGRNYSSMRVRDGKLSIYGQGGVDAGALQEYRVEEL